MSVASLSDIARAHVNACVERNEAAFRKERREGRQREIEQALSFLHRKILDETASGQLFEPTIAEPQWEHDERLIVEIDGLRLLWSSSRYLGGDYGYSPESFALLRPCGGCGAGEATTGRGITSLYSLGEALAYAPPSRCEGCWEEQESVTVAAPPTTEERLLAALRDLIDSRVPEGQA